MGSQTFKHRCSCQYLLLYPLFTVWKREREKRRGGRGSFPFSLFWQQGQTPVRLSWKVIELLLFAVTRAHAVVNVSSPHVSIQERSSFNCHYVPSLSLRSHGIIWQGSSTKQAHSHHIVSVCCSSEEHMPRNEADKVNTKEQAASPLWKVVYGCFS